MIWVVARHGRLEWAAACYFEVLGIFLFELADVQHWWWERRDLFGREGKCSLELRHGLLELRAGRSGKSTNGMGQLATGRGSVDELLLVVSLWVVEMQAAVATCLCAMSVEFRTARLRGLWMATFDSERSELLRGSDWVWAVWHRWGPRLAVTCT
jgi:hypothetical protein